MMLVTHLRLLGIVAFSCVIKAQPVANLQERAPQGEDRPGFIPEVTSLIASLAGDGWNGLLDAIYGDDKASSALAAATSAVAAGNQGAAASYFSEATAAVGDGWSQATDGADGAWSSFTSAYDENNNGNQDWTSETTWTDDVSHASTSILWSAPTSTPKPSQSSGHGASSAASSDTGNASRLTGFASTGVFVAASACLLLA